MHTQCICVSHFVEKNCRKSVYHSHIHSPYLLITFQFSDKTETQVIRGLIHDYQINVIVDDTMQGESEPQPTPSTSTMFELLAKHSRAGTNGDKPSCLEEEVNKFTHSAHTNEDVLEFWKKNQHVYPRLAIVAKAILAIPITSASAESSFSIAGCLIRSRRASIAPHRVEKVLFVHDNYNLFHL